MCLVSFIFAGIAQLGRAAGLYSVAPDKRHFVGLIPTAGTIYIGERQSRRAGAVCKTVAFELSGFDSHLSYQI